MSTRLATAQQRLEQAVERLELATRDVAARGQAGQLGLDEELKAVQTRCVTLEKRTRDVSHRLDSVILKLRKILEKP